MTHLGAAAAALLVAAAGCDGDIRPPAGGGGPQPPAEVPGPRGTPRSGPWDDIFNARRLDYNLALRTAALKLVGDLPTLEAIQAVAQATDPATAYAEQVDRYLADPRFAETMIGYFRNVFRTGGSGRDTAATFAAQVVVSNRSFLEIFTATAGTCPTWDPQAHSFQAASCANGVPAATGVLTDPGVLALWYGNLAFRRVRWLQESFVCRKFPAEFSLSPRALGNGQYTSPWPFESVPDRTTGRVDFRDTQSVVCANCHTTMNHLAPLFANFDENGQLQGSIQVHVPVTGLPLAQQSDWLVDGQTTAWRLGEPVADLPALGAAMAADPDIADCAVARVWNWAMSKTDIVTDATDVPDFIVAELAEPFAESGFKLKTVIRQAFLSDDFVRF
jgi:hypothetical protein